MHRGYSRFLANIESLLQQLDETKLDNDICVGTLLDRLQHLGDGGHRQLLTRLRWVRRDLERFELTERWYGA